MAQQDHTISRFARTTSRSLPAPHATRESSISFLFFSCRGRHAIVAFLSKLVWLCCMAMCVLPFPRDPLTSSSLLQSPPQQFLPSPCRVTQSPSCPSYNHLCSSYASTPFTLRHITSSSQQTTVTAVPAFAVSPTSRFLYYFVAWQRPINSSIYCSPLQRPFRHAFSHLHDPSNPLACQQASRTPLLLQPGCTSPTDVTPTAHNLSTCSKAHSCIRAT